MRGLRSGGFSLRFRACSGRLALELPPPGLLERVVVEEVTLDLRRADAELPRRQRLEHLERPRGSPRRRCCRTPFQNGLSGSSARTVSRRRAERRAAVLRARLQPHPGVLRGEHRQVADDRALRFVLHLRLERPARLEQVAPGPAAPTRRPRTQAGSAGGTSSRAAAGPRPGPRPAEGRAARSGVGRARESHGAAPSCTGASGPRRSRPRGRSRRSGRDRESRCGRRRTSRSPGRA